MSPRKPTRAKGLGVTDAEYAAMLARQGGGCAICGGLPKRLKKDGTPYRLQVDHDHRTGAVRGLLCFQDNHLVLAKHSSPARLRAAAAYLERHA